MENNNRTKIIIIALVSIVIILLIAITVVSGLRNKQTSPNLNLSNPTLNLGKNKTAEKSTNNKLIPTTSKSFPSPTILLSNSDNANNSSLSNLDISLKTTEWIEALHADDGTYNIGLSCTNKSCEKDQTDKQIGVGAIWAYGKIYTKTKNQSYLTKIKQEIDSMSQQRLQPDYFHCKFLYDLSRIPELSEQKVKLEKICGNSAYLKYNQAEESKIDINQFKAQDALDQLTNKRSYLFTDRLLPQNNREFEVFASYASNFVNRYYFFDHQSYSLNIAKAYFDAAINYLITNKNIKIPNAPIIAVAALDMYQATTNEEYLEFAKQFLTNLSQRNLPENIMDMIYIATANQTLAKLTKQTKYADEKNTITEKVINQFFDYSGYPGYRNNIGSFHNGGSIDIYHFNLKYAFMMVGLLSD